ncbi:MAG: hypothetical protein U9O89_06095 [Thermoproteota archaeon]|nr:hypothetical protein [Thermoproteota archaeon]
MKAQDRKEEVSWWRKIWNPISSGLDRINLFLSKRYVWIGLLLGFLWMFPAPFVLYTFLDWFKSQQNAWIIFFPLRLSTFIFELFVSLKAAGPGGVFAVWMVATVIGMLLGLAAGYVVRKLWLRSKRDNI